MSKTTSNSKFAESTSTPWFGVTMGLLGLIVGYGISMGLNGGGSQLAVNNPTPTPSAPTPSAPTPTPSAPTVGDFAAVDPERDWIRGNPDAKVTLIEWSDAECPFCARHHSTPIALLEKYGDDVNWVYRHYPLSFHPNAQKSAEAQECVGELAGNDAFWEYTDLLFEKGAVIANLADYAEEIGVDAEDFQTCLDSDKYAEKVANDMADGSKAGVTGTPGNILVNNDTGEAKLVSGAQPASAFEAIIDTML